MEKRSHRKFSIEFFTPFRVPRAGSINFIYAWAPFYSPAKIITGNGEVYFRRL
jgi:hypothetical protein